MNRFWPFNRWRFWVGCVAGYALVAPVAAFVPMPWRWSMLPLFFIVGWIIGRVTYDWDKRSDK